MKKSKGHTHETSTSLLPSFLRTQARDAAAESAAIALRDAASWANAIARVPDAACHLVLGPKRTHTHICKQRHLEARNKPAPETDDYTKPYVHCPSDVFAHPSKALNPARVESSSKRTAKCLSNIQGVTPNEALMLLTTPPSATQSSNARCARKPGLPPKARKAHCSFLHSQSMA